MTDRLRDLQSRQAGGASVNAVTDDGDAPAPSTKGKDENFMKDFFQKVDRINVNMNSVKTNMSDLDALNKAAVNAVTPQQVKDTSKETESLTANTNSLCGQIRDQLKADNKDFKKKHSESSPSEVKIRENMQNTLTKRFIELMKEYNDMQALHRKQCRSRVQRQFEIVKPGVSQDEIDRVVESKESVFAQVMFAEAGHAQALSAYQEIEERHQAILRIEQSIAELQQLFQDMAVLVDAQGEVIDQIEKNVTNTVAYTGKGVEELKKAEKYQRKARKKMCILIIIALSIMSVLLLYFIRDSGTQA